MRVSRGFGAVRVPSLEGGKRKVMCVFCAAAPPNLPSAAPGGEDLLRRVWLSWVTVKELKYIKLQNGYI